MFIRCRARVHSDCHHGRSEDAVDPYYSMAEDGTYDPDSQSVVCTPCYVYVGVPTLAQLPDAIAAARARQYLARKEDE